MSALKKCSVTLSLMALIIVGTITAAPAPFPRRDRPAQADRQKLLGTWKQVFIGYEGGDNSRGELTVHRNHWVITSDKITIFTKGKQNRGSWTYKLDPTRTPATIDLTAGTTYPCIYKLEGDRLTVLLQNFPQRGRPQDFSAWGKPGVGRHVFERVKSGEVE